MRVQTPASVAALPLLIVIAIAVPACKGPKIKPAQTNADLSQVVARIDQEVVTVGDLQEKINKQSPFVRARYTSVEKKKEFLDSIIRFEVMAAEAKRRGYDQDPEVIRMMKQQMISKFVQKDFESKLKVEDVPDADVEKYYKDHPDEFNRPDEVRVTQIFTKEKGKADKAHAAAKAAAKTDQKAFRDLVTQYSEDEDSKQRAGDLTFFDKATTMYPKPIVDASFALAEVGDISTPVKTDKGWHILKLTQKRPGFSRPLTEVKRQIQQRLFRDLRTKAMDEFTAGLRKKTKVEIFDDKLGKVLVDTGMQQPSPAGAAPGGVADPQNPPVPPRMAGGPGGPPPGAVPLSKPVMPATPAPISASNPVPAKP